MRKIELYIPKTPTTPRWTLEAELIKEWGGFTSVPGEGVWRSSAGCAIAESVAVYTIFAPEADPSVAYILEKIVEAYKESARQDSVLYSIDGEGRFV